VLLFIKPSCFAVLVSIIILQFFSSEPADALPQRSPIRASVARVGRLLCVRIRILHSSRHPIRIHQSPTFFSRLFCDGLFWLAYSSEFNLLLSSISLLLATIITLVPQKHNA
jgi:hypothetical protein